MYFLVLAEKYFSPAIAISFCNTLPHSILLMGITLKSEINNKSCPFSGQLLIYMCCLI